MRKLILFLLLFLLLISTSVFSQQIVGRQPTIGAQVAWDAITDGLIVAWVFNQGSGTSSPDLSLNGNDAILGTAASWVVGSEGYAVSLPTIDNPTTENISAESDLFAITSGITIEIIVTPTATGESFSSFVSGCDGITTDLHWTLGSGTGSTFFSWRAQDSGEGDVFSTGGATESPITNGVKYHLVGTYDGVNAILYMDGLEVDRDAASTDIDVGTSGNNTLVVGTLCSPQRETIQEIFLLRLWNRALTKDEIWTLNIVPYAIFEKPFYGRMLAAAAAAAAAVERRRFIKTND